MTMTMTIVWRIPRNFRAEEKLLAYFCNNVFWFSLRITSNTKVASTPGKCRKTLYLLYQDYLYGNDEP